MYEQPKNPETVWTKETAYPEILAVLEDIDLKGNNDREFSQIREILKFLKQGIITPDDAVEQAHAINDSKLER